MSQQIEDVFAKYKKVFKGMREEIKEFLLKHFENAFYSRPVIKVDRTDATKRLKLSGFSENLSSWRNFYRNIVVSSCVVESGVQKRYDYKFYFSKEKVDEATIDIIQNALDEASRLRRNFRFDEAIAKIDEMIDLARRKKDAALQKILNEKRDEVVAEKEKYDKAMEKIAKLEDKIKINKEYDNLKPVLSDCDKIIKLADSIKRKDIAKKYAKLLGDTEKEMEERKTREKALSEKEKKALEEKRAKQREQAEKERAALEAKRDHEKEIAEEEKSILEAQKKIKKVISQKMKEELKEQKAREKDDKILQQISELEESVKKNRESGNLKGAMNDCEKIIRLANSINRDDIAKKYADILDKLQKELDASKAREKEKGLDDKMALKDAKAREKVKGQEAKKAQKEAKAQEKYDNILEQISILEDRMKNNRENGNLKAAMNDCEDIINLANSIGRRALVDKYSEILEDMKKELEAKKAQEKAKAQEAKKSRKNAKAQEKYDKAMNRIYILEDNIKTNQEDDNLILVVGDCQKLIIIANSIDRNDLAEKYSEILRETQNEIEIRRAESLKEKIYLKEKLSIKGLIALIIFGGILIIIASIANILILFTLIYDNINVTIRVETADTFFIFLYVNGCISLIGGILVIFGVVDLASDRYAFGKSVVQFGVAMALIGLIMFLLVGLWAALLCGKFAALIILLICLSFIVGFVGILLTILFLNKIEERKGEQIRKYTRRITTIKKKTVKTYN